MGALPELSPGPLGLRRLRPADAADLAAAANHREVWRNLRDRFPHPYLVSDAEAFIALTEAEDSDRNLAITLDDRVVGGIGVELGADVHRFCGEVGYWLAPQHWGRGHATAALCAFAPWALERFGLVRLEASVKPWNPASARVLEKCGFEREGIRRKAAFKDGQHLDLLLYARLRDDLRDP